MTERNFPPGKWYCKEYFWVFATQTYISMLHLFGFAVFLSQRTEVFSTCNRRAGLPQSQCTRAHHPFCYHVPCLHCSSTLGAWDGAAVSGDGAGERAQLPSTSEFCKAGMLQAPHPLASVPHLHLLSSHTGCGHTAWQHLTSSCWKRAPKHHSKLMEMCECLAQEQAQGAASAAPATIWWLRVQAMILWLPMFNFINLKVAPLII